MRARKEIETTEGHELKPYKSVRQYEYVLENIKKLISVGTLKPGDRLPSERELSSRLEVGRASVKEAFRILEILGLIEVKHGDGSFIKQNNFHFFESIANAMELFGDLTAETMHSFLDFRGFWEIKCAALAAKNATDEDIKMMENEIRRMENCKFDEAEFKAADINFHNLMCLASKTKGIMLVVQGLRGNMITFFNNVYPHILSDPERSRRSFVTHYNIMQAIRSSDETAAVQAMEEHLKEARNNLIASHHIVKAG